MQAAVVLGRGRKTLFKERWKRGMGYEAHTLDLCRSFPKLS